MQVLTITNNCFNDQRHSVSLASNMSVGHTSHVPRVSLVWLKIMSEGPVTYSVSVDLKRVVVRRDTALICIIFLLIYPKFLPDGFSGVGIILGPRFPMPTIPASQHRRASRLQPRRMPAELALSAPPCVTLVWSYIVSRFQIFKELYISELLRKEVKII